MPRKSQDPLFDDDEERSNIFARLLPSLVLIFAFGGFVALAIYAYKAGSNSGNEEDLTVIEADSAPLKEKPSDPGGMQFPNQDKTIFETFSANGGIPPKVERVLPAPEEPLPQETEASVAAASSGAATASAKTDKNTSAMQSDNSQVAEQIFSSADSVDNVSAQPTEVTPKVLNVQEELGKQAVAEITGGEVAINKAADMLNKADTKSDVKADSKSDSKADSKSANKQADKKQEEAKSKAVELEKPQEISVNNVEENSISSENKKIKDSADKDSTEKSGEISAKKEAFSPPPRKLPVDNQETAISKAVNSKAAEESTASKDAQDVKIAKDTKVAKDTSDIKAEKSLKESKNKQSSSSGRQLVQLGSYKDEASARLDFIKMKKKHQLLSGKTQTINRADLGDKGVFYRLRVSTDDAKALCGKLSAAGQACMTVSNK